MAIVIGGHGASSGGAQTDPDLSSVYLQGDCNCDGKVDFRDLTVVLAYSGLGPKSTVLEGDANRDRFTNFGDVTTVLTNFGRSLPDIGPVAGMNLQVTFDPVTSFVTVHDPATGIDVLAPSGCPSWEPYLDGEEEFPELSPTLSVVAYRDGYDLIAKYENSTGAARSLGVLNVPGIRFGEDVLLRDFRFGGKAVPEHVNFSPPPGRPPGCYVDGDQTHTCCGYEWPGDYYSPVLVIENGQYTVAASIQYPLLNYKHAVRAKYESFCWQHLQGGQNWRLNFQLNNRLNPTYGLYNPEANIQPGEKRTYVVSVRIARNELLADAGGGGWLRLLQTYRRYFRCLYGPVCYERDPRPVAGVQLAMTVALNGNPGPNGLPINQFGYIYESRRPDLHGWGPWVAEFNGIYGRGWNRIMMWCLSGLYFNSALNFPFQFYTGLNEVPLVYPTTPILSELGMVASVSQPGVREYGLWWGHAADFATVWNPPALIPVDPDNPAHMAEVYQELQGAIDLNATMVGLDALGSMWQWQTYWYLQDLQTFAPGKRMIEESRHSDFMHTLAPMYDVALDPVVGDYLKFDGAHYMADFLNPGHEFWGQCDQSRIQVGLGLAGMRQPTIAEIQGVLSQVAAQGFIVLNFTEAQDHPPVPGMTAAESWRTSVPAELRP